MSVTKRPDAFKLLTPLILRASRVKTMWGADGAGDAIATKTVKLNEAGKYRVWVRYIHVAAWRGPFQVAVAVGEKTIASQVFDREVVAGVEDWEYTWQSFDAELPTGDVTLSLAKHEQKNCIGYVRHVYSARFKMMPCGDLGFE